MSDNEMIVEPTRAQIRQAKLDKLRASARANGTTAAEFPTAHWPDRLADLAKEINARFRSADRSETVAEDHRLAAALRLAEAKDECVRSGQDFKEWAEEHVKQSYETVRKLAYVGHAPDPVRAMGQWRERNAVKNRQLRLRAKAPLMMLPAPAAPKPRPAPSIDALMAEFCRMTLVERAEFLRVAAESIGSLDVARQ